MNEMVKQAGKINAYCSFSGQFSISTVGIAIKVPTIFAVDDIFKSLCFCRFDISCESHSYEMATLIFQKG